MPSDLLVHLYRPWQLAAAERLAATVVARLRGQADILEQLPHRSTKERMLEASGWFFGSAGCAITIASVAVDGPSYLAAASMFASAGGFAVAAWQRDLVHEAETERGAALRAVLDQLAKVELAIERLNTLRTPAAPGIATCDSDDRSTS